MSSIIALGAGLGFCLSVSLTISAQKNAPQPDHPCGPPDYCARTDRRTEPYPQDPAKLGPASSILTDAAFGSKIVRVTDGTTDPKHPGWAYHTPSSAEQNPWNSTTTKFYLIQSGGRHLLFNFDPSTLSAHPAGYINTPWRGEPQFSYQQPNVLYGLAGQPPLFQQYDVSDEKLSTIHDPSGCVHLNPGDWGADISASADDNRFSAALGPQQDAYYLVYIYDRRQGCRWYNTMTGEVGGQWGPAGPVTSPLRFPVHDARLTKSGDWITITAQSPGIRSGTVFWEVGTRNVTLCAQSPVFHCSGHHATGYSHMINPSGWSDPMDLLIRPLNNVKDMIHLIPDLPPYKVWFDKHISWNDANPEDTIPACFSTYRDDNPTTPGAPLKVDRAWENEVDCVETDGKAQKVWRFAHTYSTGRSFWATPRGNVSQDGRYYMFTSDWEEELGKDSDGHYRTDAFIVQLR
ncbi:MAG TPA: hypothetical protein VL523_11685 [Terriglobia bacterium]|nr:hypothetical protein [Terriglobia bacterium]